MLQIVTKANLMPNHENLREANIKNLTNLIILEFEMNSKIIISIVININVYVKKEEAGFH